MRLPPGRHSPMLRAMQERRFDPVLVAVAAVALLIEGALLVTAWRKRRLRRRPPADAARAAEQARARLLALPRVRLPAAPGLSCSRPSARCRWPGPRSSTARSSPSVCPRRCGRSASATYAATPRRSFSSYPDREGDLFLVLGAAGCWVPSSGCIRLPCCCRLSRCCDPGSQSSGCSRCSPSRAPEWNGQRHTGATPTGAGRGGGGRRPLLDRNADLRAGNYSRFSRAS